jgi:hypothetical protein
VDRWIKVGERDEERTGIENAEQKEGNKTCRRLIKLLFCHVYSRLCNYPNNSRLAENLHETWNVAIIFLLHYPHPLPQTHFVPINIYKLTLKINADTHTAVCEIRLIILWELN